MIQLYGTLKAKTPKSFFLIDNLQRGMFLFPFLLICLFVLAGLGTPSGVIWGMVIFISLTVFLFLPEHYLYNEITVENATFTANTEAVSYLDGETLINLPYQDWKELVFQEYHHGINQNTAQKEKVVWMMWKANSCNYTLLIPTNENSENRANLIQFMQLLAAQNIVFSEYGKYFEKTRFLEKVTSASFSTEYDELIEEIGKDR